MKIVYEGGQGEIIEKKSRFICTVRKIATEEEALEFVNEIKKKYWDARHNCMAYVLGDRNEIARFSDDGEPQGTAGKPMLDVITVKDIHNVAVVVTRYFGGILLGTGGLIRAYQSAVNEGLANSVIIERFDGVKYSVITDYNGMGKIQYIINMEGYHLLDTIYTDNVEMIVVVENDKCQAFENKITEATAARAIITSVNNVSYGISDNGDYIEI